MVAFVILHYKNLTDTLECIASIRHLKGAKTSKIIVVDNASGSKEDDKVLKKHADDLLIQQENLGFARGNNVGCKYAIEKYQPDFLCVLNSDIVIDQENFIEQINNIYNDTGFDLLGPKILTNHSDSVNPFPVYRSLEEVEQRILYTRRLIRIYQNRFLRVLLKVYCSTKRLFRKERHLENGTTRMTQVALHGCAIIFSKQYYRKYSDIFYPHTFLFHEEEFLYYRIKKDHLTSVYDPSLALFHKEGSSLAKEYEKENYQKLLFRNREILKSLEELKRVMKEERSI